MNKPVIDIKQVDRLFYEEKLKDFLPDKIIDIHTHIWKEEFRLKDGNIKDRSVSWPDRVANYNTLEDLMETYRLMFPDKQVTPMVFSHVSSDMDMEKGNRYTSQCAQKYRMPSLLASRPEWSAQILEESIKSGGFSGSKVYLNYAPSYIPANEIRIFDFLPHHQLEVLDKNKWIVMLHIPRPGRLKDPVNHVQMLEIERRYPGIKLVIAHVGRAYCFADIGNAFEVLSESKNMLFDISANTNADVFSALIKAVGPQRILFGSDLPIVRMRMRRECKNGRYVNLVQKGLYGDISADPNMEELPDEKVEKLTFFLYEEIEAFRKAALECGLSRDDVEAVFYGNAYRILKEIGSICHG